MQVSDAELILQAVKALGIMVLENGGETYRAEDIVLNVCSAHGADSAEVFALPTGLFIQVVCDGTRSRTVIKRVKKRGVNLFMVDAANDISRRLSSHAITPQQAIDEVRLARQNRTVSRWKIAVAAALSVGCFSVLFGGGISEFFVSALSGGLIHLIAASFRREDMFHFIISLLGGIISALAAVSGCALLGLGSVDIIVGSAIMLLVPGLALVNAIRDTMRGDLSSGTARMGEVFVISMSIAAGVCGVLGMWGLMGGGAL